MASVREVLIPADNRLQEMWIALAEQKPGLPS